MAEKVFCDTNVLVYAEDRDGAEKREIAAGWIERLWREGNGVVSVQVLQELYVTLTRKVARPMRVDDARRIVAEYLHWETVDSDGRLLLEAMALGGCHRLSFWDALVVQAAIVAGAETLLTEDLNHGQRIEGVTIRNPFVDA